VTEPVCARAVLNPGLPERAVSAYSGRRNALTEPVCARAVLNPGLPERAVSAYSGRRNAPASDHLRPKGRNR